MSQSTGMDILLQGDFEIEINDTRYKIEVPEEGKRERCFCVSSYLFS